jgi:hypothetical protein
MATGDVFGHPTHRHPAWMRTESHLMTMQTGLKIKLSTFMFPNTSSGGAGM